MTTTTPSNRHALIGVICTLTGAIGFSLKPVLVKAAYLHGIDPVSLLTLRMLFSAPFFALMAVWAGPPDPSVSAKDWRGVICLGFLGYYLGSYLDLAGLQWVSAGFGRLVLYLYPTLVVLLSWIFLRHRLRGRELLALALTYGGIALVFRVELGAEHDTQKTAWGASLVFAGALTYATYLVAGSRLVHRFGSTRFAAYASLVATGFVLAHFTLLRPVSALRGPIELYGVILILAVAATVLPVWLMAEGLRHIGANRVSLIACVGPVATMAFATVFLGESISLSQLAGAILVLTGVVVISWKVPTASNT
jgi:drug/metabolite transporter (DMT)-like permease